MEPREPTIVLKVLEGNDPIALTPLQQFLTTHIEQLEAAWILIWCLTALIVLIQLFRAWRKRMR